MATQPRNQHNVILSSGGSDPSHRVENRVPDQLHNKVVTESGAKASSAVWFSCFRVAVLAGPEFVTTRTFCPSGFSKATCSTPAIWQADSNLLAPRRTLREKCAKAQY